MASAASTHQGSGSLFDFASLAPLISSCFDGKTGGEGDRVHCVAE